VNDRAPASIGVGQLLDRAVSGYVGVFLPIVAILAIEAVPAAVLTAFGGEPSRVPVPFAPAGRTTATVSVPDRANIAAGVHILLAVLAGSLIALFTRSAAVIFIDGICEGRVLTIGASLRRALPRWLPQVGLALIFVVLYVVVVVAIVLVFVIAVGVLGFVAQAVHVPTLISVPLGVIAIVIVLIIALALSFAGLLVYELAMVAVALDDGGPWRVFSSAVAAVFDRRAWRSTLAVAASLFALSLLGSVLSIALGGITLALTHVVLLQVVLQAVVAVLLGGLVQWFIVLYARAVRERRSGDDLIRLAETVPA
jgi:hypothetical protein